MGFQIDILKRKRKKERKKEREKDRRERKRRRGNESFMIKKKEVHKK
jgi:hypothetical protein